MSIVWTHLYSSLDDGSILTGANIGTIQNDISTQAATVPVTGSSQVSGISLFNLSSIPSGAGIIPSANLPVTIVTNYRSQMYVMQASITTITVAPGILEVNSTGISKTANTTLTLSTASDWAGGVSLQAVNTTGYVGVDSAGNIKMHTTAPTHADYSLSISAANNTKRFVSWASTTYRVIGWFRMNSSGSGQLDVYGVSNLADGNVANIVSFGNGSVVNCNSSIPLDDTIPQNTEGVQALTVSIRPTNVNNKIKIKVFLTGSLTTAAHAVAAVFQDSTANALNATVQYGDNSGWTVPLSMCTIIKAGTISYTTFNVRAGVTSGSYYLNADSGGTRFFGGVSNSIIVVEEIESQLT